MATRPNQTSPVVRAGIYTRTSWEPAGQRAGVERQRVGCEALWSASEQAVAFPSQGSMSHRVLLAEHGVYATERGACAIVHLTPAQLASGDGAGRTVRSDQYSLWGAGAPSSSVDY